MRRRCGPALGRRGARRDQAGGRPAALDEQKCVPLAPPLRLRSRSAALTARPDASAATVIYRADLSTGTYNHGPRIIRHGGLFVVSWYAGQQDEDAGGERVLFSTSATGESWSAPPRPLFDRLTPTAPVGRPGIVLSNHPFAVIGERLYAAARAERCSACPSGSTKLPPLFRSIAANGTLGPTVWLTSSRRGLPTDPPAQAIPLYTDSEDPQLRADAEAYLAGLLDEEVPPVQGTSFGERSVYTRPHPAARVGRGLGATIPQLQLVMLLREGGAGCACEWASTCDLFLPPPAALRSSGGDVSSGSSNGGGDADGGGAAVVSPSLVSAQISLEAHHKESVGPQPCNWTAPVPTSIPDAHTRTHAGSLPDGSVYLLGTQVAVRFSACFR